MSIGKPGRPDEITIEIRAIFLDVMRETGNIRVAAEACGYKRNAFYVHRDKNPEFAAAWEEAYQDAMDKLELEAMHRAMTGVAEPIMFQGRQIGTRYLRSDRLMEFLLIGGRPEKFAPRFRGEITGKGGTPLMPEVSLIETARRVAFLLTQATAIQKREKIVEVPIIDLESEGNPEAKVH